MKTTKCLISLICSLALFLPLWPVGAQEDLVSQDYRYTLIEEGTAVSLLQYLGHETEVTVPAEIEGKPVKKLDSTFMDNCSVKSVVIPSGVEFLYRTFRNCTALQDVQIPDTVFAILSSTFRGCSSLTDLTLPDSVYILDTISLYDYWSGESRRSVTIHASPYAPVRHIVENDREEILFEPIPCAYTAGDLNADGVINTTDARLALQASVGKLTLSAEQAAAADVNQDQSANTTDARLILQYAVGIPTISTTLPNTAPLFQFISTPLTHASAKVNEGIIPESSPYRPLLSGKTIIPEIADPAALTEVVNAIIRQGYFTDAWYHSPPYFSFAFEVDGIPAKLEYKQTGLELHYRDVNVLVGVPNQQLLMKLVACVE